MRKLIILGVVVAGLAAAMFGPGELRRRKAARLEAEDRAAWREAESAANSQLDKGELDAALDTVTGFLKTMKTKQFASAAKALKGSIHTRIHEEAARRRREEREKLAKRKKAEKEADRLLRDAAVIKDADDFSRLRAALKEARRNSVVTPGIASDLARAEELTTIAGIRIMLEAGKVNEARALRGELKSVSSRNTSLLRTIEVELEYQETVADVRRLIGERRREEAFQKIGVLGERYPGYGLSLLMHRTRTSKASAIMKLIAEAEKVLGPAPTRAIDMGGGIAPMEFVFMPPGTFLMGRDGGGAEGPVHEVELTQGFYIGRHEVNKAQYHKVAVPRKPVGLYKGDSLPIESVSWEEATAFCRELGGRIGRTCRLPTEAEWEYACRAGSPKAFSFGDQVERLAEHAWYEDNSNDTPHEVGTKKPNAHGIYDVHGNVWEWCLDWFAAGYYAKGPRRDPQGPDAGTQRVIRGGAWSSAAKFCRSATRDMYPPSTKVADVGFRVVMLPAETTVE